MKAIPVTVSGQSMLDQARAAPAQGPERVLILEAGRAERHYWLDLWTYRELFAILAWRDLAVRYKQTVIGVAWAVVRPFLTMLIFTFIFGRLAKMPTEGHTPYPVLVFAGMLPWFLFSTILSEASASLVGNANLISKVYFPRLIVPAATIAVALVDFAVTFVLMLAMMAYFRFMPDWRIVVLPFFILLAVLASLGPALLITAMNVKYRDFRYVIPFVLQFGLYLSPVGFASKAIPDQWRLLYNLNPMVGVIDGFRWCLLGGQAHLYLPGFAASLGVVAVMLWIGVGYFRKTERTFAGSALMVGDVVIRAEALGKRYLIGHRIEQERYVALRDVLARNARNLWRASVDFARGRPNIEGDAVEEFWALRDVSFEIQRGDVVGVIGRNGAGKSTLLKILSRITEPTKGRVEIRGRVASLLEVGTGFHHELTGRENIYLNGAVLGMTHAEIRRKFDEIVAFAEVERFLDTPVKRYSSGMYVRLAFAVAAHLEPEILIIDEVLAVGDAEFQKKCLGKMSEVADHGRTVLFVSHNMAAVASLCKKGIVLDRGRIVTVGSVAEAVSHYSAMSRWAIGDGAIFERHLDAPIRKAGIVSVAMVDGAGAPTCFVESFGRVILRAVVSTTKPTDTLSVIFGIGTLAGDVIAKFESNPKVMRVGADPGTFTIECDVRSLPLIPGEYRLSVGVAEHLNHLIEWHRDIGSFSVSYASEPDVQMSAATAAEGYLAAKHAWRAHRMDSPIVLAASK